MMGKGVLRDHPRPRSSQKRMSKIRKMKRNLDFDDIDFVDIDGDRVDNAITIDDNESGPNKYSSNGMQQTRNLSDVIWIDDDENEDAGRPGISSQDGGDLDSDASSSRRCSDSNFGNTVELDGDECQVLHEKKFGFRLSKCNGSSSGKMPPRNRYGLYNEFASCSSESDCSDCELIEGSFGKVQQQWERASLKKRSNIRNDRSKIDHQDNASGSCRNTKFNVDVENRTKQHSEAPVCSSSSNAGSEKETMSGFFATDDSPLLSFSNPRTDNHFVEPNQNVSRESLSSLQTELAEEIQLFYKKAEMFFDGGKFSGDPPLSNEQSKWQGFRQVNGGCTSFGNNEKSFKGPSFSGSNQEKGKAHFHDVVVSQNNGESSKAPVSSNASDGGVASNSQEDGHAGLMDVVASGGQNSEEKVGAVSKVSFFCQDSLLGKDEAYNDKTCFHEKDRSDSEKITLCTNQRYEFQCKQERSSFLEATWLSDPKDVLLAENFNPTPSGKRDVINEREKLKETDEYKRAVEEEWASRKRQLQIQSEEAQRLRKRRKAETMRLLDMQRRQKQRVEEVRETQKKDEENLNLKEHIRAEVRKDLKKLEMSCTSMASLLHGLGIEVGCVPFPLSQEVHAAYKRALLKFHPDRASRTDIRQQVEAEEKFKLISRMKDKFL